MPRTESIVSLLISSPSDVSPEREQLETVIAELNATWSRSLGVRLEPIRWETHSRPGFGADPQDVLNNQLPSDYDVFLGILWGRIGTPTPRAKSGTLEEFEQALARHRQDPHSVEIMIYFKDAPIPPSKIDTSQLAQVQEFRELLGNMGGLYSEFDDAAAFESSVRAHLSSIAQKFSGSQHPAPTQQEEASDEDVQAHSPGDSIVLEEDELGYFDYIEIYKSRMKDMSSTLAVISDATTRVGELMKKRTEETNAMLEAGRDEKQSRKIIKMASSDITNFSQTLAQQLPLYSDARKAAFGALSNTLALYEDFDTDKDDLQELSDMLSNMLSSTGESKTGLNQFRESITGLPRLTVELNRAKRKAAKELDNMFVEIETTEATVRNILDSIEKMQ